ncbi:GNAT family N-acetyltransferase [Tenggerimyces flavus]|uniref:GNAT family N-acetyltransferase n=1 Tax=Tenggerimyces flavus TaxID=1708749 RepID=A0ABV7YKV9_9ACTN|nr:ribosomal protein S18 acetylase RimI-like enzyme [Tenggerimyces flavus]
MRSAVQSDAGEILTLQRAAFVDEARRDNDFHLPALTQTLRDLEQELQSSTAHVAILGARIVGAVRTRQVEDTLYINRLTVAPDWQGRGVGTALMGAAEREATAKRASLFVRNYGEHSVSDFYSRLGYVPADPGGSAQHAELVRLVKDLTR